MSVFSAEPPPSVANEDVTSTSKDTSLSEMAVVGTRSKGELAGINHSSKSDRFNRTPKRVPESKAPGSPPQVPEGSNSAKTGPDNKATDTIVDTGHHQAVHKEKSGIEVLPDPTQLTPRADGLNLVLAEVRKKSVRK